MKRYFVAAILVCLVVGCNREPKIEVEYYKTGEKKEEKTYDPVQKAYTGAVTQWHKNGQVGMTGTMKLSRKDGLFTYYDKEGWKNCEATYNMGKRWGNWYYFNEEGDTVKIAVYEGGDKSKEELRGFKKQK